MKKYIFILKTEIISNLQYTLNNIIGFIGCFIIIFTFFNLWMYIYDDPSNIINGYTMNQMIWYMVITEAIYMSVKGRHICKKIKQDIRSGNIAYNLNKPYNYILYNLFSSLGDVSTKLPIYLILGSLTGLLFLKTLPNLNITSILITDDVPFSKTTSPPSVGSGEINAFLRQSVSFSQSPFIIFE